MRINVPERAARRYAAGATLLVVPVEPQPNNYAGDRWDWPSHNIAASLRGGNIDELQECLIASCPARPGDVLDVVIGDVTHHPVVVSVAAKMLGQLTVIEMIDSGCKDVRPQWDFEAVAANQFASHWTADHGEWQPERWVWLYSVERTAT